MTKMRVVCGLMAIMVMLAVFVAGSSTTSAHEVHLFHGNDFAWVSPNHTWGEVCDNERDGHWVYAEWYLADGSAVGQYDSNGSRGGCSQLSFWSPAVGVMICEENKRCNYQNS